MKLVELAYFTDDVNKMANFYHHLLGVEPVARSENMAIFMADDTKIMIHRSYEPKSKDLPPYNHMAFAVEDVDAACQKLEELGLTLEVAPRDYYWGRSAYLRDPDGHQIELIKS